MDEIVKRDLPIVREEMDRDEAVKYFNSIGEHYKAEIIGSIPAGETISLYRQGDYVDLCRGPHVPSTGRLRVHKLMKLAGAYWRGDSKNEMLQRIYGTAWAKKDDMAAYLYMLEEARKTRSSPPRQRTRSLPFPGRSSRPDFLACTRLGTLAAGRTIHAPCLPR